MRAFWRLASPFWRSEERFAAWALLASVIALNLGSVYMLVQINSWYNAFYNTIQTYDQPGFVALLWYFLFLAAVYILIVVYQSYLNQMLQIRWRRWLTGRYVDRWLSEQIHYRMQFAGEHAQAGTDNPDQRISEDVRLMCDQTLDIGLGLMNAVVTLASFVFVLWNLSGPAEFTLAGVDFTVPGYMVWAAVLYSALGTWIANLIGRPLVRLNFMQQRFEADFRYGLMRLRENSEGVALYRGEGVERARLGERFGQVFSNYWQLMERQKKLTWFLNGYNQLALVFPFMVAAPRFFAKEIQLGGLMQISSAFGQVHSSLSYLINAYTLLATWKATVDRLTGFDATMREAEAYARTGDRFDFEVLEPGRVSQTADARTQMPALEVRNLTVALPDGRKLVDGLDLDVAPGEAVLVSGASGSGKSTMLRALAGIWPFGHGSVRMPERARVLFLPQRPYLPLGTLRAAICYPLATQPEGAQFNLVLARCGLAHLAHRLDDTDQWARVLSGGEQQRVGFARALLVRPALLFLDEATSALDEPSEAALYALLRETLPDTAVVSIGHRSSLRRWHASGVSAQGDAHWTRDLAAPA
ncbi:MAG: ABC transporter ATP-binding protein/permease [Proteobacteria bacterium]|nr:ABC transporter ATP-binding protein/permease [Burkholderiales bacterium]